ncbi:MAG: helix-turn-helix domain-containing protein [Gemmataceae bacterium]
MPHKAVKPGRRKGAKGPAPDVLTLSDAAALLRVPQAGLKSDADAGRLPGRLVAGEWRFSRAALMGWLAGAEDRDESGNAPGWSPEDPIRKAVTPTNPEFQLSMGLFADDDTLEPMLDRIRQSRKQTQVGD